MIFLAHIDGRVMSRMRAIRVLHRLARLRLKRRLRRFLRGFYPAEMVERVLFRTHPLMEALR